MRYSTGALVAAGVALTVFAGPLFAFCQRVAAELLSRAPTSPRFCRQAKGEGHMSKRIDEPRDQRIADALDEASGQRNRATLRQEWPLLLFMTLVWGALWQDFTPGT